MSEDNDDDVRAHIGRLTKQMQHDVVDERLQAQVQQRDTSQAYIDHVIEIVMLMSEHMLIRDDLAAAILADDRIKSQLRQWIEKAVEERSPQPNVLATGKRYQTTPEKYDRLTALLKASRIAETPLPKAVIPQVKAKSVPRVISKSRTDITP